MSAPNPINRELERGPMSQHERLLELSRRLQAVVRELGHYAREGQHDAAAVGTLAPRREHLEDGLPGGGHPLESVPGEDAGEDERDRGGASDQHSVAGSRS